MSTSKVSSVKVFERDTPLFVESDTGRLAKYPRKRWMRWGLRVGIALVFVAIAIAYNAASGSNWSGTANAELAGRVDRLSWGSGDISVLTRLYPPITSLVALVIPGGAFGLSLTGALVAGLMVQLTVQSMQRKGFDLRIRVVFALTLATTPIFAFITTTNLEATLGLMFFGLGMLDLVRFVTFANTQAGFRAGILFACSAFSDSTGVFSALVAAIGGALLIQSRAGSRVANLVVVAFPTITLFGSLALLGIAFGAGPLAMIRGDLGWDQDRAAAFVASLGTPLGWLYLAPMVLMIITAYGLRFSGTGLIAVLLTAGTVLAYIVGLTPPGTAGITYMLMLLLAVAIVPVTTTTLHAVLTIVTSVLLWLIGWMTALQWPVLQQWMHTLIGAG